MYGLLTEVYAACKSSMRNDQKLSKVWYVCFGVAFSMHGTCPDMILRLFCHRREAATAVIKQKNEGLLNNFVKNCGFGMGLEFRDASLVLNKDNTRVFRPGLQFAMLLRYSLDATSEVPTIAFVGMVFNLCVGFENLKTSEGKTYAMLLADTVLVLPDGEPDVLTHMPRSYKDVTYQLDDGNDQGMTIGTFSRQYLFGYSH